MLSPLPPFEPGSIGQKLLADPPDFDRASEIWSIRSASIRFFERALGMVFKTPWSPGWFEGLGRATITS